MKCAKAILLIGALALCAPARAADEKSRAPSLQRPDWGRVTGWVMDATTRAPVERARVSVEIDGAFPDSGKATDLTDPRGRYDARAPLGKISSKFDWGRLLTMHPISLVLSPRSITKQTRILDVTQVNARVEAEGYRPFVGRVRATRTDAERFAITLDDVWLAPESAPLVSFTPDRLRHEVIEGLKVEPEIASPGEKVRITLATRLPVARGIRYEAFATSSAIRLIENPTGLKREKGDKDAPQVIFTREITLPKSSVDTWTEVGFYLVRDGGTVLRQRDTRALLQIVRTPEERAAAEKIAAGFRQFRSGNRDAALQAYSAAMRARPGYSLGHLLYGDLCLQLNRPRDAAAAFRELVRQDPRDFETARSRYALALVEAGNHAQALAELADAEKVLGKQRIPSLVSLCRARAAAAQGDFDGADRWLAAAGADTLIPTDVLTEVNLKRMAAAVRASPDDPDLRLSYARVLESARRGGESVAQIRRAAKLQPDQPWAFIDLGQALLLNGQRQDGIANLRHALRLAPDNAEALLALGAALRDEGGYAEALQLFQQVAQKQPLNLRARHNLALMLYAAGKLPEARRELLEVVNQAREKGDIQEDGLLIPGAAIYVGPKKRLVAGFSVPEAAADAAILEALQDLERHPGNALLWQNIGSALLDLDLPGLALTALQRSRDQDPALPETRFLQAVAYRKLGKTAAAQAELSAVIAANPLHPQARLELAQLYTDAGSFDQAHAQILAHNKNYPYERPARTARSLGG